MTKATSSYDYVKRIMDNEIRFKVHTIYSYHRKDNGNLKLYYLASTESDVEEIETSPDVLDLKVMWRRNGVPVRQGRRSRYKVRCEKCGMEFWSFGIGTHRSRCKGVNSQIPAPTIIEEQGLEIKQFRLSHVDCDGMVLEDPLTSKPQLPTFRCTRCWRLVNGGEVKILTVS